MLRLTERGSGFGRRPPSISRSDPESDLVDSVRPRRLPYGRAPWTCASLWPYLQSISSRTGQGRPLFLTDSSCHYLADWGLHCDPVVMDRPCCWRSLASQRTTVRAGRRNSLQRNHGGDSSLLWSKVMVNGEAVVLPVHIDRSELDERGGAFTGLKRTVIEGRIKQEAAAALAALRDKLEGAQ
jgi:hypothetical protein